MELYYWRDYQHHEVDFVVKKDQHVDQLIQVSHVNTAGDINSREIRSLIKAAKVTQCKILKIITWECQEVLEIERNTIQCVPLWKWLIEQ